MHSGICRTTEATVAAAALIVSLPVLFLAALLIAVTSGFPVFFSQRRVGRGGRSFTLFKLRTMRTGNAGPQVTSSKDQRITAIGRVLRRLKIDELPGLWNVVRGDLSLVGPRPEVPRYVDLNNPVWRQVLAARPGLTDPVTVLLRNEEQLLASLECDPEEFYTQCIQPFKLSGYVEYLRCRSWGSDVRTIFATGMAIVRPDKTPPPTAREIEEAVSSEGFLSSKGRLLLSRSCSSVLRPRR